eukprot:scaffold230727_cov28-Tisochrysis_lutea.AAC.1
MQSPKGEWNFPSAVFFPPMRSYSSRTYDEGRALLSRIAATRSTRWARPHPSQGYMLMLSLSKLGRTLTRQRRAGCPGCYGARLPPAASLESWAPSEATARWRYGKPAAAWALSSEAGWHNRPCGRPPPSASTHLQPIVVGIANEDSLTGLASTVQLGRYSSYRNSLRIDHLVGPNTVRAHRSDFDTVRCAQLQQSVLKGVRDEDVLASCVANHAHWVVKLALNMRRLLRQLGGQEVAAPADDQTRHSRLGVDKPQQIVA